MIGSWNTDDSLMKSGIAFVLLYPEKVVLSAELSVNTSINSTLVACCSQYATAITSPLVFVHTGGVSAPVDSHASIISRSYRVQEESPRIDEFDGAIYHVLVSIPCPEMEVGRRKIICVILIVSYSISLKAPRTC